jgi:hypothetical protein
MKSQVRGIKTGQTIQLLESINIPDGKVTLEIQAVDKTEITERLERLNCLFGVWKNQPDLDRVFTEIDRAKLTLL